MTRNAERTRDAVIGAIITFVLSLIFMLVSGGWSSKESVSAHQSDIQSIRSDIQRVLDVVCDGKRYIRQCQPAPPLP